MCSSCRLHARSSYLLAGCFHWRIALYLHACQIATALRLCIGRRRLVAARVQRSIWRHAAALHCSSIHVVPCRHPIHPLAACYNFCTHCHAFHFCASAVRAAALWWVGLGAGVQDHAVPCRTMYRTVRYCNGFGCCGLQSHSTSVLSTTAVALWATYAPNTPFLRPMVV